MASEREAGQHRKAAGKKLKAILGFGRGSVRGKAKRHKQNPDGLSLKQLARTSTDMEVKQLLADWLYNKRVDTSNPPQGIGRTNRINKGNNGKKK